jgi:hypothetical protein
MSGSQTLAVSEPDLLYDWRFTVNQFVLATNLLRLMTRIFFYKPNAYGHTPYTASCLMRGWVSLLNWLGLYQTYEYIPHIQNDVENVSITIFASLLSVQALQGK